MEGSIPTGHEAAAAIAFSLVPQFDHDSSEDQLKRVLCVLAKIPGSAPERFVELLGGRGGDERDRVAMELQTIVFDGIEGMALARDLPQVLVEIGRRYFLATESDVTNKYRGSSSDSELLFGIRAARSYGFFPPSALRGPFRPLLQFHPKVGCDFVVEIFNHSAAWYADRRVADDHIEPALELTLTFADGATKTQRCSKQLWQMYRGASVVYVLQSTAMAFEAWLFELAEAHAELLDRVLVQILRASDSAALTAIAASVAIAHPRACGETLLVLFSSPECIRLDRVRLVHDQTGSVFGRLPHSDAMKQMFACERAESDARPHRQQHLESVLTTEQAGPLGPRIQQALDRHRAALSPVEEQTDRDRIWRLALHRMDLRNYPVAEATAEAVASAAGDTDPENPQQYIMLTPTAPDPDLQQMVDASATQYAAMNAGLGLQMWGTKVFQREDAVTNDPAEWRQRLAAARASDHDGSSIEDLLMFGGGTAFVAAVCLRDHDLGWLR